jgi:hypothetical protein
VEAPMALAQPEERGNDICMTRRENSAIIKIAFAVPCQFSKGHRELSFNQQRPTQSELGGEGFAQV